MGSAGETCRVHPNYAFAPPGCAPVRIGGHSGSVHLHARFLLSRTPELRPLFQPPTGTSSEILATLQNAAGVVWLDRTNEVFVGDNFVSERLRIASGAVQVRFKRGAKVIVEGPADLQLVSDNEAYLRFGKVTAHVPKEAHGFTVTSPTVAVVDLGTDFGLSASSNSFPEVHVFTGSVEMARPDRPSQQMTEGQAARLKGTRVRKIAPHRESFLFDDGLAQRVEAEQGARYQVWKAAAAKLSSDPAAVVHYTFENEGGGSCLNRGTGSGRIPAGTITGCQWTDGRWPEKRALAFTGKTDRVRFVVPNTFTSMTYMAWLRVDQF